MRVTPVRLGLAFGFLLGIMHALWAMLVALGLAQPLMDFIFWAHFITPPYHIEPFAPMQAAILVAFVFAAGFCFGAIGGVLWNKLARAN